MDGGNVEDIILDVHEGVFCLPFETFKDEILAIVKRVISFDMAIWGSGVQEPQLIFSIATHDFPLDRLMAYSMRWQPHDALRRAVAAQPGQALRNEDLGPIEAYYSSEIYGGFCGPAGIEHTLGIAIIDPITNVGELIFLFRSRKGAFYADAERDAMTRIMPHLTTAWRHRQIMQFRAQGREADKAVSSLPSGHAIIDDLGQVHASDADFGWGVRRCFPDWIGPRVPDALMSMLDGGLTAGEVDGHRFVIVRGQDRHILALAGSAAPMLISPAEHRVALLYAEGRTARDVAGVLGISPMTVRNHLTSVYAKTGVHSKVALAKWLSAQH